MLQEDKQSSSVRRMEASCLELPLLQAQLQTCELEEKAASERAKVSEGWLQGAAAEAKEAMTMARKMATAEVACLAEVTAASESQMAAQEEARTLRLSLQNAEAQISGGPKQ